MLEAINAIIDAGIDFIEVTWEDDLLVPVTGGEA